MLWNLYAQMALPSLQYVLVTIGVIVFFALLRSGITKGAELLRDYVKTIRGRALIDFCEKLALTIVASLSQTEVPKLRQAALDGRLNEQQAKQLLAEAMAKLKAALGAEALKTLDQLTGSMPLEEYLQRQIETAVRQNKRGDLVAVLGEQRSSKPPAETEVKQ
jgi:hypothetical protein